MNDENAENFEILISKFKKEFKEFNIKSDTKKEKEKVEKKEILTSKLSPKRKEIYQERKKQFEEKIPKEIVEVESKFSFQKVKDKLINQKVKERIATQKQESSNINSLSTKEKTQKLKKNYRN
jgi:hypothetical protein